MHVGLEGCQGTQSGLWLPLVILVHQEGWALPKEAMPDGGDENETKTFAYLSALTLASCCTQVDTRGWTKESRCEATWFITLMTHFWPLEGISSRDWQLCTPPTSSELLTACFSLFFFFKVHLIRSFFLCALRPFPTQGLFSIGGLHQHSFCCDSNSHHSLPWCRLIFALWG